MKSFLALSVAVMAASSTALAPSLAADKQSTRYEHYLVTGESAQSLFESMLRNGPIVGGKKTYASVRMEPEVEASTAAVGSQCRVASFKLKMTFTIRLPLLDLKQAVEPSLHENFKSFYDFARRHEESHRQIWLHCAAEAEALAMGSSGATCGEAEAQSLQIVQAVSERCNQRHAEFDAGEQKLLGQHEFIRQARLSPPKAMKQRDAIAFQRQRPDNTQGALTIPQ